MSDALPPRPIADRLDADEAPQDWPRPAVGLAHPDRLAVVEAVIALPLWEPATQRALDRVARLALRSFDAWQALVTLVESDELLVVSARGEGTFHSGERCPLPTTLCHLVVQRGEPLVVRDAREDPRFRSFREVTEQGVVAYAGVPLVVRGAVVGTVVIVDRVPRDWPAGAADVLRDLADSAVTELELRATLSSERSFASLAEHLPDCLSRVDRDRRYAYANDAFARALDVPAARIVGTRIGTFPRDAARHPACRALIERAFDEGAPITTTLELPVDGVTRWFELRLIPERDVDEEIESVLWILRDVTADVLSARRLRDREEQLRAIFQQAIVGVCMLQSGRIVYGNPRLAEMLGYESADALTELDVVERLVAPEWRARVREALAQPEERLRGARPRAFTALRRDGTRIEVEAHGAPTEIGGRPAIVGIILDVTTRNALELRLRQAQKMEAVGQLAAGVAHDFNNLLAAIVANAHLALDDLRDGKAPSADDVHGILDAAGRAAELTRRLLAFGRHEPVQPVTLDLGEVVRGMEALLRRVLPGGCHLALLAAGPALPILADRGQLEQLVMNLVVNARDAMPGGGTITIETATDWHPTLGHVAALTVTDTGVGMDARVRDRAFEPFFTTKERGRGTGLGLTTVHAVTEQAGGVASIESAPGQGTMVRIAIPLARGATADRRASPGDPSHTESPLGGAPPIVLLAEDEEAVRRTSKRMLERAGYHVLAARHGADALRVLEQVGGTVDVLVSDVSMPELDGVSLATRARALIPDLGVVLVSGYTDILNEQALRALDAIFLAKPFSAEQLTRAVAEMVGRKRSGG